MGRFWYVLLIVRYLSWSLTCFVAGAGGVLSMWLILLMLFLCLGYVAPMGVSLACTMWRF
jgi:hypothetical protein